jgi:large subunit ribosomal protein L14
MLFKQTKNFKVADNSGAIKVKCIGLFRGSRKKVAYLNDWILLVVKKYNPKKKIKKKLIYFGLVISVTYRINRKDGVILKFINNRVLLFSKEQKFLGTRVYGPICKEFKKNIRFFKFRDQVRRIISYSRYTV